MADKRRFWFILSLIIAVGLAGAMLMLRPGAAPKTSSYGVVRTAALNPPSPDPSQPKSIDCRACHADLYADWAASHHALANRLPDAREAAAFASPGRAGEVVPTGNGEGFSLQLESEDGPADYAVDMVIGHDPLRQYLLPWPDGGWQTTQVAWDPHRGEWFDIFDDGRGAGEWGAWTGRGMNWNASCAYCHMTDFEKNYDPLTDRYTSAWHEQGVGCIQCHAPTLADPPPDRVAYCGSLTLEQHVDNCAACHSRRGDFEGTFRPGQIYADHFHLELPTREGSYYPDGQIRDEVYVWTSLRQSTMGHAGVRCLDCHDPHSNALVLPAQNNMLCQRCHATGFMEAPIIAPAAHSFHPAGSAGNRCVECHMPHTVYMGRDPRRDHGFHHPDPQLTLEMGIPNACARCHEGQDPDAATYTTAELATQAHAWWGEAMNAVARDRAQILQAAYRAEDKALPGLLRLLADNANPYWQATFIELLAPWARAAAVQTALAPYAQSPEPRVRAAVAQVLGPYREDIARAGLTDPIRSVRHLAASVRSDLLPAYPKVAAELMAELRHNADQPNGALRLARELIRQDNTAEAERWFRRALAYDAHSAAIPHEFAFFLNRQGRRGEAARYLQTAAALAPEDPLIPFHLGLARAEMGDTTGAESAFAQSVARDPHFARAHYNLGLLLAGRHDLEGGIMALLRAERADPQSPDYPYARATLHVRQGETAAAQAALDEALRRDPSYAPARQLRLRLGPE